MCGGIENGSQRCCLNDNSSGNYGEWNCAKSNVFFSSYLFCGFVQVNNVILGTNSENMSSLRFICYCESSLFNGLMCSFVVYNDVK